MQFGDNFGDIRSGDLIVYRDKITNVLCYQILRVHRVTNNNEIECSCLTHFRGSTLVRKNLRVQLAFAERDIVIIRDGGRSNHSAIGTLESIPSTETKIRS